MELYNEDKLCSYVYILRQTRQHFTCSLGIHTTTHNGYFSRRGQISMARGSLLPNKNTIRDRTHVQVRRMGWHGRKKILLVLHVDECVDKIDSQKIDRTDEHTYTQPCIGWEEKSQSTDRVTINSETGRTCTCGLHSLMIMSRKMCVTLRASISQAWPSADVSDASIVHTSAATAGVNPGQLVCK